MDTATFLRRILPSAGNYIVAKAISYTDKATGATK